MQFKQVLVSSVLALCMAAPALADEFCDGYKEGYKTGYKQAADTNLNPLTPLCPLKPLKGFGDPKSDFEFGYTLGFKEGTNEGSKR